VREPAVRAPDEKRSLDDIVADAVRAFEGSKDSQDNFAPFDDGSDATIIGKGRIREYPPNHAAEDEYIDAPASGSIQAKSFDAGELSKLGLSASDLFELDFRDSVRFLNELDRLYRQAPVWGNEAANRHGLKAIGKQSKKLQEALNAAPGEAIAALFSTVRPGPTRFPANVAHRKTLLWTLSLFVWLLSRLSRRCDQLAASPPGGHGRLDASAERVADEALRIVRQHGKKVSWSETGLFKTLTVLLWEAMTGEVRDFERHCNAALRRSTGGDGVPK
jgi:hypothetical protein